MYKVAASRESYVSSISTLVFLSLCFALAHSNGNGTSEYDSSPQSLTVNDLDRRTERTFLSDFPGFTQPKQFGGKKFLLIDDCALHYIPIIREFQARSDDTWVVSFPRSGTTWVQEMVWLLSNDLDFETANSITLEERFPFLEVSIKDKMSSMISSKPSPRFIKSHLPFSLLPSSVFTSGAKIIYIARNPKDVAVSNYHFQGSYFGGEFHGIFSKFWTYFESNLIMYSPYWEHLKEAWAQKQDPNVLFLFYEEMSENLLSVLHKTARFLHKSYTEDQFQTLYKHLQFRNMRKNNMINFITTIDFRHVGENDYFIRKGKVGGWKKYFSPDLNAQANHWIRTNLESTDLSFPYVDVYE